MNDISPQLQNQITQYQQIQQQLQALSAQKAQMEAQMRELERTSEELSLAKGDVFRNVGSLLIKVDDKEALKSEIEESMEMMDVRVKGLERQEKSLLEKFDSLQKHIDSAFGRASAEEQ